MKKILLRERDHINAICEKVKKEQRDNKYGDLPALKVSRSHGTFQYHAENHYISKRKMDYIESLPKKEYYENLIPNFELFIRKCDELIALLESGVLDSAFHSLCEGKQKLLIDVLYYPLSERMKNFEMETYEENRLPYEMIGEIYTNKGEKVRSKSEKIIADELYRRGIPYHYEKPLVLDDRGRKVVLHPDFTTMNVTNGRTAYLEHLGLMNQPEYCQNVARKLSLFERNGLLLGRDVLLLHESSSEPLNIRILNQYLDEFLE